MPSTITSLTILGAAGLITAGVDGADAADTNGWAVELVMPDTGSAVVDVSKIVIPVADSGYDAAGNLLLPGLGGPVRTLRGTAILRRQYPNNAARLNSAAAGTRKVYFALSGPIYASTQIGAASAELGWYNAAEGSIPAVTNNSGRAYPKPLFAWLNAQHEREAGASVYVEGVVFHRWARGGRQVACVKYQAVDEIAATSAEVTVSAPILSTLCKQGQPPEVFAANVPQAGLRNGDLCRMNAKVYPFLGDASAVLDLLGGDGINTAGTWSTPRPYTPLRFVCDRTGAYGGALAYVRPTGTAVAGDTTKVFAALQVGLSNAQCFATADAAFQAIQAWNLANRGHNDIGGSIAYLTDDGAGGAVVHTSLNVTRTAGKAIADIRKDPNAAGAVSVTLSTQQAVPTFTRIAVKVTHTAANGLNGGNAAGKALFLEDMTLDTTGSAAAVPIHYSTPLTVYRNVTLTTPLANTFTPFNGPDTAAHPLLLGVVTSAAGGAGVIETGYTVLGCRFANMNIRDIDSANHANQPTMDRGIWANNIFNKITDVNKKDLGTTPLTGFAVVQNVFEDARAANGGALLSISADGTNAAVDNIIIAHNTFPAVDITGRFNFGYADTAVQIVKRMFVAFNLVPGQWNTKTDVFQTAAPGVSGRTGNWSIRYGVETIGNVIGQSTNAETAADPNGVSWIGEYLDPSNRIGALAVGFTDQKAGQGAAGFGTYTLTGAANDAYNRVPLGAAILAYDIRGKARRNDGLGAAGAYESDLVVGAGGGALGAIAEAGAGKVAVGGQGGAELGPIGAVGQGGAPNSAAGAGNIQLGAIGEDGAGKVAVGGQGAEQLGDVGAVGQGAGAAGRQGAGGAQLGGVGEAGAGKVAIDGDGAAELGQIGEGAGGKVAIGGAGSAQLGDVGAAAAGQGGRVGHGAADLGQIEAGGSGALGAGDSLDVIRLADAKEYLRVLDDSEDSTIADLLATAIEWVEGYTGHLFKRRQVVETFPSFAKVRLSAWPIASIDEIEYVGSDYLTGLVDVDDVTPRTSARPARLLPVGGSWPATAEDSAAVSIKLTAGYATKEEVPNRLRQAALLILAGLYVDRETGGLDSDVEKAARSLCSFARELSL